MKRVFLDANIIIDYLSRAASKEEAIWATNIIDYCFRRSIAMVVSTHSVMILSYFLTKELQDAKALNVIMKEVVQLFEVVTVEKQDILTASESKMTDFEDAVQLGCAIKALTQLLITKNIGDFYSTNLPIVPPDQFFDFI